VQAQLRGGPGLLGRAAAALALRLLRGALPASVRLLGLRLSNFGRVAEKGSTLESYWGAAAAAAAGASSSSSAAAAAAAAAAPAEEEDDGDIIILKEEVEDVIVVEDEEGKKRPGGTLESYFFKRVKRS
jgi:hypothetical protein